MWTVYLLHLDRPIGDPENPVGWAQHYNGSTNDLLARIATHKAGRGAKMLRAAVEQGVGWEVFILADNLTEGEARHYEWYIKQVKKAPIRFCPHCGPSHRFGLATLPVIAPNFDPFGSIPQPEHTMDYLEWRSYRRPYHGTDMDLTDPYLG